METPSINVDEESDTPISSGMKQRQVRQQRKRRRCCICWIVLASFLLVLLGCGIGFYFIFFRKTSPNPVASCGDCHCIPDPSGDYTCPSPRPPTEFSIEMIQTLASQVPLNPYKLDCNPYVSDDFPKQVGPCETTPPQDSALIALGETAVCGIHYESYNDGVCSKEYRLQSYASWQEAEDNGAFVTHAGACGVCSTTQDLAAYLNSPDLTTEGSFCAKQSILDYDLGKSCYMELGMTSSCADIWVYNSLNTAEKCLKTCATTKNKPNNGPPPTCTLNVCLECDEEISGPNFKQFAARTRRRSGLLSAIARPCEALVPIVQEACPETTALAE